MKRFDGKTDNGASYEVILIDNSIALVYIEPGFGSGWQSQKTEYRIPMPGFFNIEDFMFGSIVLEKDEDGEDEDDPITCRVEPDEDGADGITVKLTNEQTSHSVEWTFTATRSHGPFYIDEWGNELRDIIDGTDENTPNQPA